MDDRNISIPEAADLSGVASRNIEYWRTGKSTPRLDLFVAVCNAVGIAVQLELDL